MWQAEKMPHSCSAWGCTHRCTFQTRSRGITFHRTQSEDSDVDWEPESEAVRRPTPSPAEGGHQKCQRSSSASTSATSPAAFPKDEELRKKWEVALRREGFCASQSSMLCSEHFRREDFDTTGQTVRIRDGAIPFVFSSQAHLKMPVATRTSRTSKKAQESLSVYGSQPVQETEPPPVPIIDHSYALPTSPNDLRARLTEALARVESLERQKRNAQDRERRAKNMLRGLLEDLRGKKLINDELKFG